MHRNEPSDKSDQIDLQQLYEARGFPLCDVTRSRPFKAQPRTRGCLELLFLVFGRFRLNAFQAGYAGDAFSIKNKQPEINALKDCYKYLFNVIVSFLFCSDLIFQLSNFFTIFTAAAHDFLPLILLK